MRRAVRAARAEGAASARAHVCMAQGEARARGQATGLCGVRGLGEACVQAGGEPSGAHGAWQGRGRKEREGEGEKEKRKRKKKKKKKKKRKRERELAENSAAIATGGRAWATGSRATRDVMAARKKKEGTVGGKRRRKDGMMIGTAEFSGKGIKVRVK